MTSNMLDGKNSIDQGFVSAIKSKKIYRSIYARLKQYDLMPRLTVDSVLSEAYLRGINALENGKKISHVESWLMATSRHIIYEESRLRLREIKKLVSFEFVGDGFDLIDSYDRYLDDNLEESINILMACLDDLSKEDKIIVFLRVGDLSWQDIQLKLQEEGYSYSLSTLRQRYGRIISRLRLAYEKKQLKKEDDDLRGMKYEDQTYYNQELEVDQEQEFVRQIELETSDLKPLDRKIFLLRSEGKSFSEIAEQLVRDGDYCHTDSLQNTLIQRFNRIRKRIQEKVRSKISE
jgi:DNA-directed RNA polymerase specialized sigma24 family protein